MSHKPTQRPSEEHEELVHADDKVIGRAVIGSAVALILVAAMAGGVIWVLKRKPEAPLPLHRSLPAFAGAPVACGFNLTPPHNKVVYASSI